MAHTHDVYDMENHFEINGSSRFIKETSETKLVVVQGDHKSEVLTFKMPRYIDGHDMTLCDKIRIHYINLDTKTNNKSADVYEVTDLTLCEECEDVLTFTWTIEAPATKYSGTLSFLVKFECTEGENVLYQWNTAKYVSVNVLAGIDNSEEFVEKYSNVLEEWYNELTKGADTIEELNQQAITEIELAKEDAKEDIQGKANSTMAAMTKHSNDTYISFRKDVEEQARQTLELIPDDYEKLADDVEKCATIKKPLNGALFDENTMVTPLKYSYGDVGSEVQQIDHGSFYCVDLPVPEEVSSIYVGCMNRYYAPSIHSYYCVDDNNVILGNASPNANAFDGLTFEVPTGTKRILFNIASMANAIAYQNTMFFMDAAIAKSWMPYELGAYTFDGFEVANRGEIKALDNGVNYFRSNLFGVGTLINGVYDNGLKCRIASKCRFKFNRDVVIRVAKDFMASIIIYNQDGTIISGAFLKDACFVEAGTEFGLLVKRETENTQEVVTVEEFISKVYYYTHSVDRILALEQKNHMLEEYGGRMKYIAITGNCASIVGNCAESIIQSAHAGMDGVEVDVRLTKDGDVVLSHDADVSKYTNAPTGTLVSDKTVNELKEYIFTNQYIPTFYHNDIHMITLSECIDLCKQYGMEVQIDIKSDGYDEANQELLLDRIIEICVLKGIDKSCVFISTNQNSRLYIREKLPHAKIAYKTYVDQKNVEQEIEEIKLIHGNILLQAETTNKVNYPLMNYLTDERVAKYRELELPIKDIDYRFTQDKETGMKSGIQYTFFFSTTDGGQTFVLNEHLSSKIARENQTSLVYDGENALTFECHGISGDMLRNLNPSVSIKTTDMNCYSVITNDLGIRFNIKDGALNNQNVSIIINIVF